MGMAPAGEVRLNGRWAEYLKKGKKARVFRGARSLLIRPAEALPGTVCGLHFALMLRTVT
jgi:hypothetical protein